MLTQEQTNGLNLQLHAQEAAQIGLNQAQEEINKYVETIKKMSEAMNTATPEQREKLKALVPQITEGYNNAKLKKATYEDQFWQATSKINDYKALDTQQSTPATTKRRQITPSIVNPTNTINTINPVDVTGQGINAMLNPTNTINTINPVDVTGQGINAMLNTVTTPTPNNYSLTSPGNNGRRVAQYTPNTNRFLYS